MSSKKEKQKRNKIIFTSRLIALFNLIFSVLLIITYFTPKIHPFSNLNFLSILGIAYPIIFIINLIFAIFWLFIKPKYIIISLIPFIFGINSFNLHFKIIPQSTPSQQTLSKDIEIMTYNVQLQGLFQEEQLRKEKENGIINFLRSKHPNILCMQEFRASSGAPYKFLKIIKDTISSKNYYFQRYFKDSKNSYGLAIYSDYSIINKQILKDDNNRVYSISVDLKVSSDTIRVFNTHFESNRLQNKELKLFKDIKNINKRKISDGIQIILSKLKKAYRNRVPQINRLIEAIKNSPYPVVLCGDFNEPPSSWAYHNISKYLKDSFIEKGFGTGITYNGYIPMLRIDYIFTSDNIKVDMVESHKIPYSDHYPQSAWISLEKN